MTIEEAKELAEKLNAELAEKKAVFEKLHDEGKAIEKRLKEIQSKQSDMRSQAREIFLERDTLERIARGFCQQGLRRSHWSDKRWESSDCKKKAKPGEELCGIHLNVKKRDEENRKRWSGNA